MTKNICFFCGDVTRNAGTERAAVSAAIICKEAGWNVFLLSLSEENGQNFSLPEAIPHEALFDRPVRMKHDFFAVISRLSRRLKKNPPDVLIGVEVMQSLNALPAILLAGLRGKCRYFAWEHFHFGVDLGCRPRRLARRLSMRFADAVIVLTERDRRQYLEAGARVPVVCIPNSVPELPGSPVQDRIILPEEPFVLSVGRIVPEKGFDRIPAIAENFLKTHPAWKWIILGAGPDQGKIEADIRSRGLENKVIFAGQCNPVPYYRTASVFALTSRFEGFGLVLAEALAHGVPSVAFDCACGPATMIDDRRNGFLVFDGDIVAFAGKLSVLADQDDIRKNMASAAVHSMERFQKRNIAPLWRDLLDGGGK